MCSVLPFFVFILLLLAHVFSCPILFLSPCNWDFSPSSFRSWFFRDLALSSLGGVLALEAWTGIAQHCTAHHSSRIKYRTLWQTTIASAAPACWLKVDYGWAMLGSLCVLREHATNMKRTWRVGISDRCERGYSGLLSHQEECRFQRHTSFVYRPIT